MTQAMIIYNYIYGEGGSLSDSVIKHYGMSDGKAAAVGISSMTHYCIRWASVVNQCREG